MNKNLKALENLIHSLNGLDFKKGFNQESFEIEKFFFKMLKVYIEKAVKEDIPEEIKFSIEVYSFKVYLHHGFRKILLEDFSNIKQEDKLQKISEKRDILVKKAESELKDYVVQYKDFKRIVEGLFSKLKKEYYKKMAVNYPLFSNEDLLNEKFNLNMYDFGYGFSLEMNIANEVLVKIKNIESDLSSFSYDVSLNQIEKSIRLKLEETSIQLKNIARSHVKTEVKSYLIENYPEINYEFRRKFLFAEDSTQKRVNQKHFPINVLISKEDLPTVSRSIYNYFKLLQNETAKKVFFNFSIQDVEEFNFEKGIIPSKLTDESLQSALNFAKSVESRINEIESGLKHNIGTDFKIYKSAYYKTLKSFELNKKSYVLIRYRTHLSKKYKYISLEDGTPISRTKFNRKQKKSAL